MSLIRWYIHASFGFAVSTDTFSDRFEGVSEWDDTADAIVDCVRDKLRNLGGGGILVRFESKNAITIANIAHESSHIAMNIFDYIGAKVDLANQETFSYLVGWGCWLYQSGKDW